MGWQTIYSALGIGIISVGGIVATALFTEFGKKLLGTLWDVPGKIQKHLDTPAARRVCTIPFSPLREKFAGRASLLKELAKTLTSKTSTVLSQRAAVRADGGIGKTALAIELGWQLYERGKFDHVLFLNATDPAELERQLAALCEKDKLDLAEKDAPEQEPRLRAALAWLKTPEHTARTLLILDNADSPDAQARVRTLHAELPHCPMLITSRGTIGDSIPEVILDLFTPEEAREFLKSHLDLKHLQQSDAPATLDGIAAAVDHLPLALEIVTSYLLETHQSPQEWLHEWHTAPDDTLRHHNRSKTHYPVSLSRVWEQCVTHLSNDARELLHALAWLAPRPAALPLESLKALEHWSSRRADFAELERASLIQWAEGDDAISIHRILQTVTRHGQTEEERSAAQQIGIAILNAAIPNPEWSASGWPLWERLAPHLQALFQSLEGNGQEAAATGLMNNYGLWLYNRTQFTDAEPLMRRALAIDEKSLGPDHPTVALRLNNFALLLKDTGRLSDAEPLMRRALAIDEKSLGPDHPTVAANLSNLALLLQATDRHSGAEPLVRRALAIDEKSLGPDHLDVATDLNNLATLLMSTDRLAEAEPLSRRAVEILLFAHARTDFEMPNQAMFTKNYSFLLKALGKSDAEIDEQLAQLAEAAQKRAK